MFNVLTILSHPLALYSAVFISFTLRSQRYKDGLPKPSGFYSASQNFWICDTLKVLAQEGKIHFWPMGLLYPLNQTTDSGLVM